MVFYGQDTGCKLQENHDELSVLLPLKEFEHNILHHLEQVDGVVLRCREKMIHQARTRCRCKTNNKTAAMRKNSQQRLWLVCRKSGAVTEHLIRHNAGEDKSERERENDQCGRREPRSGNTQVHRTEIVNCAVEIQTVQLLARHAGAAVGKLSDELLKSVEVLGADTCTGQRKRLRKRLLRCPI